MYISLRIRKRVMLCVIAVLSMLAAVAVMPTFAKEEKADGIKLPIIMYHSIVKDEGRSGEYVITPIEIEKDLLYLKQNGYTTVFVNDVIRYVKRGGGDIRCGDVVCHNRRTQRRRQSKGGQQGK